MKLPITVIELNGDMTTYQAIRDAEISMEAIDVENNEYRVIDAEGNCLKVIVVLEKKPVFFGLFKVESKCVKIVT